MARSNPTAVVPDYDGAALTPTAPDATGDVLDPGDVLVVVATTTATPHTDVETDPNETVQDPDVGGTVPTGSLRAFRVPPARLAAQPGDAVEGAGRVLASYSSVAGVTRYVLKG